MKSKILSVIIRLKLPVRLLQLSKKEDLRKKKKRKSLDLERCRKRLPTDSPKLMLSVQSVLSKKVNAKLVRKKLQSARSYKDRQLNSKLPANANS